MSGQVIIGDNRESLKKLISDGVKVQCCVTSPPYFGLRDYGTGKWEGGDPLCDHKKNPPAFDEHATSKSTINPYANTGHAQEGYKGTCGKCGAIRVDKQIGLESTPEEYVSSLVEVFALVWELLNDDGTLWLNLGDSYYNYRGASDHQVAQTIAGHEGRVINGPTGNRNFKSKTLKVKDVIGIPWMTAFALRDAGRYLRSPIVWAKPNCMPESVTDRPTKSYEMLFLLTKQPNYYYDADAIKEPYTDSTISRISQDLTKRKGTTRANGGMKTNGPLKALGYYEELTEETKYVSGESNNLKGHSGYFTRDGRLIGTGMKNKRDVWWISPASYKGAHYAVFPKDLVEPCILAGSKEGDIILDPFAGSGTVGEVANELGRKFILLELNEEYLKQINERVGHENKGFF